MLNAHSLPDLVFNKIRHYLYRDRWLSKRRLNDEYEQKINFVYFNAINGIRWHKRYINAVNGIRWHKRFISKVTPTRGPTDGYWTPLYVDVVLPKYDIFDLFSVDDTYKEADFVSDSDSYKETDFVSDSDEYSGSD